jgi:hypothetical protein
MHVPMAWGGLWLSTDLHQAPVQPTIWRAPFPAHIRNQLVSSVNPTGDVSNSDLELAGYLLGHTVLRPCSDQPTTVLCATDNTPTQAWVTRGSPTSNQQRRFSFTPWDASAAHTTCLRLLALRLAGLTHLLISARALGIYRMINCWRR